MVHLVQIGVGSGGIAVLDALARDMRIQKISLIDPDRYSGANADRHLFPASSSGQFKTELAKAWLLTFRPELEIDLFNTCVEEVPETLWTTATLVVCAADTETAKYEVSRVCLKHRLTWTLGEVLSGGIAGWVHRFVPDGPCYGCVSSHLLRTLPVTPNATDYSAPQASVEQTRIPASKASIAAVAGLHAIMTAEALDNSAASSATVLLTMAKVPGIFDRSPAIRSFSILKDPHCLICGAKQTPEEDIEAALARVNSD